LDQHDWLLKLDILYCTVLPYGTGQHEPCRKVEVVASGGYLAPNSRKRMRKYSKIKPKKGFLVRV
jgi:hypothetical protein